MAPRFGISSTWLLSKAKLYKLTSHKDITSSM